MNALIQHVVHALAHVFFLKEGHGPIVRQHLHAPARGRVWVRRRAEDRARDSLKGCEQDTREESPQLPVEGGCWCLRNDQKSNFVMREGGWEKQGGRRTSAAGL